MAPKDMGDDTLPVALPPWTPLGKNQEKEGEYGKLQERELISKKFKRKLSIPFIPLSCFWSSNIMINVLCNIMN
ncbi:hypothetical protein LXL04_022963 [Taraxacum kok-saghyz]